jgi:hypothetical protein
MTCVCHYTNLAAWCTVAVGARLALFSDPKSLNAFEHQSHQLGQFIKLLIAPKKQSLTAPNPTKIVTQNHKRP